MPAASYAVELQRARPGQFAIVKPVDPADPGCTGRLRRARLARIVLSKEKTREPNHPGLDRILRAAVTQVCVH